MPSFYVGNRRAVLATHMAMARFWGWKGLSTPVTFLPCTRKVILKRQKISRTLSIYLRINFKPDESGNLEARNLRHSVQVSIAQWRAFIALCSPLTWTLHKPSFPAPYNDFWLCGSRRYNFSLSQGIPRVDDNFRELEPLDLSLPVAWWKIPLYQSWYSKLAWCAS